MLRKLNRPAIGAIALALVVLLGTIDYWTGYELSFSLFYLAPIGFVSWYAGRYYGMAFSILSAVTWLIADIGGGNNYSHPLIYVWNTLIRTGVFLTVTLLLSSLRRALRAEQALARSDYLTGAVNSRFFYTLAEQERIRSQRFRHPLTLAYIDLDEFKWVNDNLGHSVGDEVLKCAVRCMRQNLRQTDIIARLGGDEFVLLLPETGHTAAQKALSKLRLALLKAMQAQSWPVTFSMGAMTYQDTFPDIDEMLKTADQLMYQIKSRGKNALQVIGYTPLN